MVEDFNNQSAKDPEKITEESLELEPLEEDLEFDRHLRKSYRLHLEDRDDCTVTIEDKTYPLKDFSLTGLRISIEAEAVFRLEEFMGETISGVRLDLVDQSMEDLECRIVHISPDTENQMVCGMVRTNSTSEKEEQLFDMLKSLKAGSLKACEPDENKARQT